MTPRKEGSASLPSFGDDVVIASKGEEAVRFQSVRMRIPAFPPFQKVGFFILRYSLFHEGVHAS